jgi:hypothetical protein
VRAAIIGHVMSVLKKSSMNTPTLWFYHKEGRRFGPVEEADIRGLLNNSEIAADTLVWRDGLGDWTEAQNTELFSGTERHRHPFRLRRTVRKRLSRKSFPDFQK